EADLHDTVPIVDFIAILAAGFHADVYAVVDPVFHAKTAQVDGIAIVVGGVVGLQPQVARPNQRVGSGLRIISEVVEQVAVPEAPLHFAPPDLGLQSHPFARAAASPVVVEFPAKPQSPGGVALHATSAV